MQNDRTIFAHRIVRWMAILGVFYGIVQLLNTVVSLFAMLSNSTSLNLFNTNAGWPKFWRMFYYACVFSLMSAPILLLIGSCGALQWKRWGRILVITWALMVIIVNFLLHCFYFYEEVGRSGARPLPLWYMAWANLNGWISLNILPAIFLFVFLQREVSNLWNNSAPAFEVVPFDH